MKTLELFSGTKSFSKVAESLGHSTYTVDNSPEFEPDVLADISKWYPDGIEDIDVLWASPPCTGFSVAAIGHHWTGGKGAYIPKSETAKKGIALVLHTKWIIKRVNPKWWFIENPRGVLRKMPFMENMRRVTVWYCRYGDKRAKPTDIWTNAGWWNPRPPCKNGYPDHEPAPRGSKTGTQGLKGAMARGVIPKELFEEIFKQMP